jgi:hypothetical protein
VELPKRPSGLNHYPRLLLLTSGVNKLICEGNRVECGICSRATLKCPNGKKIRPQIVYLGWGFWPTNKKIPFFWNHQYFPSPEFVVSVLAPLVHAACFLVDRRASTPEHGHIFRITFQRCIQNAHASPIYKSCHITSSTIVQGKLRVDERQLGNSLTHEAMVKRTVTCWL